MSHADEAEAQALELAAELAGVLDCVVVPSASLVEWLPERLSFLLARENFNQFLGALDARRDITAGNLARALFEEAMRWSWVDEDVETRRTAFLGAAAQRHRQVDEAVRDLGIEPNDYYGPLVEDVLRAAEGAAHFPRQIEGQLDWAPDDLRAMLYTQYRLFSQYTHSSILAVASSTQQRDGELVVGRLPQVARLTICATPSPTWPSLSMGASRGFSMCPEADNLRCISTRWRAPSRSPS
jgi:hypothetical protein